MKLFFIRHKPTGNYLPEPTGRMGRGGSHVEPTPASEKQPRLFTSKLSASRALGQWLRGKVHHKSGYDSWSNEYYEENLLEPIPNRIKSEMEIIEKEIDL